MAGSNDEIKNIYKQLAYKYANTQHGTTYNDRPDVFKEGGSLIPSHQYGNKVTFNWDSTNEITEPKAEANGVSTYEDVPIKDDFGETSIKQKFKYYTPNNPNEYVFIIVDHISLNARRAM